MTSRKVPKDLASFLLYAFGFLLLWEWLRPLEQLTDTSNIIIFILFIIVSLFLSYIGAPLFISSFIKCVFIVFAIHFLYFEGSFFQTEWVSLFIKDLLENIGVVVERDWSNLSNIFRSLLFFVLLWLLAYLIQYWLIARRQIFIFFFMTLIYITVLDTFSPYEAGAAIIRTVISGFAIMGMLTFYRLLDKEFVQKKPTLSRKWMIPLTIMIVISVSFGLAAPKAEPIWPDPVPFFKSYGKGSGGEGGGVRSIGYDEDDSRLGGPFIGNDQLVFTAQVESRHYWKVETKDIYTGKGWDTSGSREYRSPFTGEDEVPIFSFFEHDGVEKEEERSILNANIHDRYIVYPLGIKRIDTPLHPNSTYSLENYTEKIHSASIFNYSVVFDAPKFSVTALMKASEGAAIESELLDRYTQLPEELPQRVRDLALEITAGKNTWYEKAKALEDYLKGSNFTYDQKEVAIPGPEDDYVDQFLFDTQIGYCDNFSTSMVIMARSLGIPTRWVKGYTEGEYKGQAENNRKIFEVTNNNAHSWVEVFFPGIGWVPFEPTKSFSNSVQFNYDYSTQSNSQTPLEQPKSEVKDKPDLLEEKEEKASTSFSFKKLISSFKVFWEKKWKWLVGFIIALIVLAFVIYRVRGKWLPYYLALRYKWSKKDDNFQRAYLLLLRELKRYGLPRKEGQTLRDYAEYVDRFFSTTEMTRLTARYEKLIYRGELNEGSWKETKKLWENLIKKTIA
ncbi:DUF4129 domain-containing transglutaminase family protein [Cytobacillus dafuensis]|uniref:DUF4129 domain-containing protein n=1 Tax=Cytobacillus dafuensis TaxID=1742359 RepID=A0A5B8Z0J1_CYTDA|nr:transglutaminaseTgpA domain-containing protein [Cytobacillus dafuensis]QED46440.1 DUF4129 domain-containing protein [Cytobacillus dafuensis]